MLQVVVVLFAVPTVSLFDCEANSTVSTVVLVMVVLVVIPTVICPRSVADDQCSHSVLVVLVLQEFLYRLSVFSGCCADVHDIHSAALALL